ncbi:hypothetical protein L1F30_01100 [Simiduia sp. 21SJ11W-1]|uniref:hypothetical protein n=1 Tax=Simiduia sp. 21SJ11W-1 TaxID=2909669 RepID=UPI0020A04B0B|nr:hypothetical protein [Simiduia sp. 21SJ11W-1]UTA48153.1 hypothetical protein L1F30_01100 [Simiduia sp. 21SJ11W-1]
MKSEVREKLEEMRLQFEGKSFDDLKAMGWIDKSPIAINKKKYHPAIWSQSFGDDELLLVVQLTRWYFLKMIGSTDCIGFTLTKEGELNHVDEYWLMHEVGHP